MDASKVRESRLCDCKDCRCYSLVSPVGGTCGGCLTGLHFTYGSQPPATPRPEYRHTERRRR